MCLTFKEKADKVQTRFDRAWQGIYDDVMSGRIGLALFCISLLALASCVTPSASKEVASPSAVVAAQPAQPAAAAPEAPPRAFDPSSVTQEVKKATFADAKALIERLNAIIQAKDFLSWKTYLTPAYIAYYSDPVVLAKLSESPVLKRAGIVLHSLQDYFMEVVYNSRQNARLDDIDFVSEDSIVAITISPQGDRLVLYNLERQNDSWKIGMGRQ